MCLLLPATYPCSWAGTSQCRLPRAPRSAHRRTSGFWRVQCGLNATRCAAVMSEQSSILEPSEHLAHSSPIHELKQVADSGLVGWALKPVKEAGDGSRRILCSREADLHSSGGTVSPSGVLTSCSAWFRSCTGAGVCRQ